MRITSISSLIIFLLLQSVTITSAAMQVIKPIDTSVTINKPQKVEVGYKYKALRNGQPYEKILTAISSKGLTWINNQECITTNLVQFAIPCEWNNCEPFEDGMSKTKFYNSIWPLRVGKSFTIGNDLGEVDLVRECVVESAVKIKTSLGEFDTLKVNCNDLSNQLTWYLEVETGRTVYHTHKNTYYDFNYIYETID